MSTRANIIVIDGNHDRLYFYRHSDGYPDGTMPTLESFMQLVTSGAIRDNTMQAAGWLVLLGAKEYDVGHTPTSDRFSGWKCGAIEPTTQIHGDIEYLYVLNLATHRISVKEGFDFSADDVEAFITRSYVGVAS